MTTDALLATLAGLQVGPRDPHFAPGLFRSYRTHRRLPYRRPDDNIFFPALIDLTLNGLLRDLAPGQREVAERIQAGVRANYPAYASLRRPELYNFYRTDPPAPFPYGRVLRRFRRFRLAEDADDTCIIGANLSDLPAAHVRFLREELVRFSNHDGRAPHLRPPYSELAAYGTWFGTGVMPVVPDVCVLCNILYFSLRRGLPLNATDRDSLAFIRLALEREDILRRPYAVSPNYLNPLVQLYHVARLWSALPDPAEHLPRALILEQLERVEPLADSLFPRLLLAASRLKLGAPAVEPVYTEAELLAAHAHFPYFIAPLLSGTHSGLLTRLSAWRFLQLEYVCPAYPVVVGLEVRGLLAGSRVQG